MEVIEKGSTRERLIEKAANLMEMKGYFGTGVNEILKETNIPKGSLYHHFPGGKSELLKEAVIYAGKKQLRRYAEVMKGKKTVVDGLKAVIDCIIEQFYETDFQYSCPIGAVAIESANADEVIKNACQQAYEKMEKSFEAYLNLNGIDDALSMARVIINMIEGGSILAKAHGNVKHLDVIKDHLSKILTEH